MKVKVLGPSDLYIGSFYRPPDKNNPEYLKQLHSLLNRTPTDKGANLWFGGDFILPDINLEDESVSQYALNSSVAHQLLNTTRNFYLDQVATEPTRVTETSSSILDLFFTSNQGPELQCLLIVKEDLSQVLIFQESKITFKTD